MVHQEDNFPKGLFWGTLISIPIWVTIISIVIYLT